VKWLQPRKVGGTVRQRRGEGLDMQRAGGTGNPGAVGGDDVRDLEQHILFDEVVWLPFGGLREGVDEDVE